MQSDIENSAEIVGKSRTGDIVLVCEHASNTIPGCLGDLGLSDSELNSHIGWDPGAAKVAEIMAAELDAVLIKQRFSRVVYDCNRPPTSIDAMRSLSEKTQISGNENLTSQEKQWRIKNIYEPFHAAIKKVLDERANPVLVTVHSFTPIYMGKERDVGVGILHDEDARLADDMLKIKRFDENTLVQRNEPYGPQDGVTHTLQKHAIPRGILNVMLEIRSDLISQVLSQGYYGKNLAGMVRSAVKNIQQEVLAERIGAI